MKQIKLNSPHLYIYIYIVNNQKELDNKKFKLFEATAKTHKKLKIL